MAFYTMGRSYVEAACHLYDASEAGVLRLAFDAPVTHLFCHGAELLLKATCMACDGDYDPRRRRHDLKAVFDDANKYDLGRARLSDIEKGMRKALRETPRGSLTDEEGAAIVAGGAIRPVLGTEAEICAADLFSWYGEVHHADGGWNRYHSGDAMESLPSVWIRSRDGKPALVGLYGLALKHWTEYAVDALRDIGLKGSPWPSAPVDDATG